VMHRAGCIKVYLGLESGSDDTLALMNKNVTVNDAMNTLDILYREGIKAAAFFLVGYPGETRESMEKTFSFALSFPFDEISFNVPYPLPGSPLYDRVKDFSLEGDWEIENETRFLYRAEFDEQWIKARISETLEKFAETKRVKQMKTV
ncbi:MAG: radical SAM protein, partial [Candidatus Latescibacter sp.]|nr:radical SAM protein [Candidatus Latescibacter sp.]